MPTQRYTLQGPNFRRRLSSMKFAHTTPADGVEFGCGGLCVSPRLGPVQNCHDCPIDVEWPPSFSIDGWTASTVVWYPIVIDRWVPSFIGQRHYTGQTEGLSPADISGPVLATPPGGSCNWVGGEIECLIGKMRDASANQSPGPEQDTVSHHTQPLTDHWFNSTPFGPVIPPGYGVHSGRDITGNVPGDPFSQYAFGGRYGFLDNDGDPWDMIIWRRAQWWTLVFGQDGTVVLTLDTTGGWFNGVMLEYDHADQFHIHESYIFSQGTIGQGMPPGAVEPSETPQMLGTQWSGTWTCDGIRNGTPIELTGDVSEYGFADILWLRP